MNEEHKTTGKSPVIIDLGKRQRKLINRLLKGKGELLDEVQECMSELAKNGQIDGAAQPVVFVVSPKQVNDIQRVVSAAAMPFAAPMLLMPLSTNTDDDSDDDDL